MKRFIFALLLSTSLGRPAMGQTPEALVVGAIRDQAGAPVVGARITLLDASGDVIAKATTATDGTFAQGAPGATRALVNCSYCVAAALPVRDGEPVIGIVRRFDALLHDAPSESDADSLPYAHIESTLALTPYVVLADSSGLLAGPVLSNRGLSRAGGLVVDHGVPNYDFAADASPFLNVPSRALTSFASSDARTAFRYGDRADAGTFAVAPAQEGGGLAAAGDDLISRYHVGAGSGALDVALSNNGIERRKRFDGERNWLGADGSIDASVSLARGTLAPFGNEYLNSSFDSARISAQLTRAQRRYADISVDHGTYETQQTGIAVAAQWSDLNLHAGVQTLGDTNLFVEFGARRSSGYYEADPLVDAIDGALGQLQLSTGVQSHVKDADLRAGFSIFDVTYSGGPSDPAYAGSTRGAGTTLFSPTFSYAYRPAPRWNADVVVASTFRLPTLLERYGRPPVQDVLDIDRNSLLQTTLSYEDFARLRASVTAYRQNTNGLDTGSVRGLGLWVAWQVTPYLSARTWFLRELDTTTPLPHVARLTPSQIDAVVGSSWLTYDTSFFRVDAIYRRDLLDTVAYSHLDYAVSSHLGRRMGWFAGSEVRHRARFLDFGIRLIR